MRWTRIAPCLGLLALAASSCSSNSSTATTTTAPGTTTVPLTAPPTTIATTTSASVAATTTSAPVAATTTSAPVAATTTPATSTTLLTDDSAIAGYRAVVDKLAGDSLNGRDNLSPDSEAAQTFLIAQLRSFAKPLVKDATGDEAFKQHFTLGANLLAVIPGSDLADQYVIVGAHYDHLGHVCGDVSSADNICNGATDNATGVAAALAVGRSIAAGPTPRRSVVIALWDAEEDDLAGSAAYLANPVAPIDHTVGYVNFDIQGSNILPHLRGSTLMIGAETGGPNLVAAATKATKASSLVTLPLSLLFGQGRSDHANFTAAGVPSVFFTDATSACYHTVHDETSVVDFPKLEQQVATAEALTRDLMNTDTPPVYDSTAPPATYADAVSMLYSVSHAEPDFDRFTPTDKAATEEFLKQVHTIVDAGAAKFTADSVGALLAGSVGYVNAFSKGTCDGFLNATP